jgi:hypothetical protein
LKNWYQSINKAQKFFLFFISLSLVVFYGIGLIPLSILIYLKLGEVVPPKGVIVGTENYQEEAVSDSIANNTDEKHEFDTQNTLPNNSDNGWPLSLVLLSWFVAFGSLFYMDMKETGGADIFDHPTLVWNVFAFASGSIFFPILIIAIASLKKTYRNNKTRKKIILWWSIFCLWTVIFNMYLK